MCVAFLCTPVAFAQAPTPAPPPAPPPADTAPAPAVSGSSSTTSLPLGISNFSSWKFERVGDHLHLINQAAIEGANLKFFADDVDLYVDTNKVVASGNVVFTNADGRISAERVEFDTATGIGTFYDASGIMSLARQGATTPAANTAAFGGQDPDVYFYGAKLEKLGPRKYRITRGGFTTCVQPTPRWEVTSGSVVLNLDDYAIARNTLLKVKGVPLMFLPVIYYPIQKGERQTGFLLPTYGTSTVRGQSISNAFFWAISRSQDATLFHDWFTRTGTGMGSEYRYIAGLQSAGNVRLYKFNQHETRYEQSGATLPAKTSYEFTGAVTQALGGRARARMRLDYFSDVFTQQIYHQNIYQASRRNRIVEAGASDVFGPLATTLLYQRNETFDSEEKSVLYGSTPKLTAVLAPQQLFGAPIYASLNSEYGYLPYRNVTSNVVTLDNSLSRVDLSPSLRVPLSRLTYLSVNTSAGYRTTYYSRSFDARGVAVPDSFMRDYAQLRTDIVGPVFTKIWDTPDSGYAERMKHVIEPAFTVDYTTAIDNVRRTPILTDTSDFVVGGTSRLTYGLTNRFMYRGKTVESVRGQTREFITVGLQQTYYSNSESSKFDTSYSSSNSGGKPVNLSPVSLTARVSPSTRVDANTRLEYDVNGLGLASLGVGSTVSAGLASGSLQFSRQHLSANSKPNSYFSSSTSLHTPNGHFTGTYALSWDLTHSTIVTQNVLATYMAQCCGLQMEFQNFHLVSSAPIPSDRRFNLSFVLAGLGTFSNFFGAFGNTLR